MRRHTSGLPALLIALALAPAAALAQPVLQERCSADSLDTPQGRARVEWARNCGLSVNVGNVNSRFVANPDEVSEGMPAMYDYSEASYYWRSYSGNGYTYKINDAYLASMYTASGSLRQTLEPSGYYKWTKSSTYLKPRPYYPTFGSSATLTDPYNKQLYRHPTNTTDCNLYQYPNGTGPVVTYYVNGYCEASCYTPEQKLLFSDGYTPILEALEARREDLVTLSPDSTLDNPRLQTNRTYSYTAELRDTEHLIYELRTASGGLLRVTNEHGVLNSEGRMIQAEVLKPGDELLKADGTPDPITSISKVTHSGKVYNLRPVTQDLVSNVVVAEGYLVGSSNFQNDFITYINRIILHKHMPEHLLP
jgi:hypothetical protein